MELFPPEIFTKTFQISCGKTPLVVDRQPQLLPMAKEQPNSQQPSVLQARIRSALDQAMHFAEWVLWGSTAQPAR